MPANIAPFHEQAEEFGKFVLEARAREAERSERRECPTGPSENTD
jgi:hypothetical protein